MKSSEKRNDSEKRMSTGQDSTRQVPARQDGVGTKVPVRPVLSPLLQRKLWSARGMLVIERFWPHCAGALTLMMLFVTLGWMGAFTASPGWIRAALVILIGLAGGAILLDALRRGWPSLVEAGHRLDAAIPEAHRPIASLTDSLRATDDSVSNALWQQHLARLQGQADALPVLAPKSRVPAADRYALRALFLLLAIAGAFIAGDERMARLRDAFAWFEPPIPPLPPRLDAWIDPPPYTGRAPVFLSGNNAQTGIIHIPQGSIAVIRVVPGEGISTVADPGFTVLPKPDDRKSDDASKESGKRSAAPPATAFEQRWTIAASGVLEVRRGGMVLGHYDLQTIPDTPPIVGFVDVQADEKGNGLRLNHAMQDDYGIAKADAVVERVDRPNARTLVPAPEIPLNARSGNAETLLANMDHGWAGVRVRMKLRAFDDLGQKGESGERELTLPIRRFTDPVAKALVEQRRNLILAPDDRKKAQAAIDSLLVLPERFTPKSGDFLMLSIAARKLRDARTDAHLITYADYLWETAIAFEEGGLSEAERALRAAQDRLKEAMERGASADEIKKLMEEMRRAMDNFMRDYAERAQRDPNFRQQEAGPNDRMMSQRDLSDLMKEIEENYRNGNPERAQELLRQLQEATRNMRTARNRQQMQQQREMGEALDELERLQKDQQQLRDETFRKNQPRDRSGQSQRQRGQRSTPGEPQDGDDEADEQSGNQPDNRQGQKQGQNDQQSLENRQKALRERLGKLRDKLRQNGAPTDEGFDGADEGMGQAQNNLKQGQGNRATQNQQRALDELGRAGRSLAEQMQRQMGQGEGEGENFGQGDPSQPPQQGRADQRLDPLGRPLPGYRDNMDNGRVDIPNGNNKTGTIGERAQRVLEELRRRLGEVERPRDEIDYIERLLRRN